MQFLKKKEETSGFEVCLEFFSLLSKILHLPISSFFVRMSTEMKPAQAEFQKTIYGLKTMAKPNIIEYFKLKVLKIRQC